MSAPVAALHGVSKHFGTTQALRDVSFEAFAGEVHALLGENGAGKSTLIKVMTGVVRPDAGSVELLGAPVQPGHPALVISRGLSTVYQDLSLLAPLTVAANLFLTGHRGRSLDSARSRERDAAAILRDYGIVDFAASDLVEDLSLGQRQRLEIVRALQRNPRVLFLDEPTSALNRPEVEWLFAHLRARRDAGTSIGLISHRMGEIRDLCDRVTILRNGENVGTLEAAGVTDSEIVQKMLGRSLAAAFPARDAVRATHGGPPALEVRGLVAPGMRPTDLAVRAGEVVGVAGLDGQGQRQLFRALAGIHPATGGTVARSGQEVSIGSPAAAISHGIAHIPVDRAREGLLLTLPVMENMSLSILSRLVRRGLIDNQAERRETTEAAKAMELDPARLPLPVSALSGGNQQKVLLGKWLLTRAEVIMLDDPTQGVDVGTKYEIGAVILRLAAEGKAVLFYSTDLDELAHLADRVVVFYQGSISEHLAGDEVAPEHILAAMTGHVEQSGRPGRGDGSADAMTPGTIQ